MIRILIPLFLLLSHTGIGQSIVSKNEIRVKDTILDRVLYYKRAKFEDTVILEKVVSNKPIFMENCVFDKTNISIDSFYDQVSFPGSEFHSQIEINRCTFMEDVLFSNAKFEDGTIFSACDFYKKASFYNTDFKRGVLFYNNTFAAEASFFQARFDQSLEFRSDTNNHITVLDFSYARLPDLIVFAINSKLNDEINLADADFSQDSLYTNKTKRWHYLNIFKSDISKFNIDYQHFRLCFFNPGDEDQINKLWKGYSAKAKLTVEELLANSDFKNYIKAIFPTTDPGDSVVKAFILKYRSNYFPARLSKEKIISIYEKVLKSFDSQGQKLSYETLDIEYKDFKNGWFFLPHWWNTYGYRKQDVFAHTLTFLLLFTFITFLTLHRLNKPIDEDGIYHIGGIPHDLPITNLKSFFQKLWYSLMYTSTIFFLFSLKIENINFKKLGIVYVLIVYSTGILCIGYMAAFVLQK